MARAAGSKLKVLGAVVPLSTYALAVEQAHKEKRCVSQMCTEAIRSYLKKQGAVIKA